jgi:hypothetical protein
MHRAKKVTFWYCCGAANRQRVRDPDPYPVGPGIFFMDPDIFKDPDRDPELWTGTRYGNSKDAEKFFILK